MPVIDTSFLIRLTRGDAGCVRLSSQLATQRQALWIPAAVWAEFLAGFGPEDRAAARDILREAGTFAPFDQNVADMAAALQHNAMSSGKRRGWHDIQVAATALHLREPLVTTDQGFAGIDGLVLLSP